jgi:hypothetical protein
MLQDERQRHRNRDNDYARARDHLRRVIASTANNPLPFRHRHITFAWNDAGQTGRRSFHEHKGKPVCAGKDQLQHSPPIRGIS